MRTHQLTQLVLGRIREFTREPEAVFWAILFPVLLAAGLGIAFAGRPESVLKVGTSSSTIAQALRQEPGLDVTEYSGDEVRSALTSGKIALDVEPGTDGSVLFRYDDTSPDGRTARRLAEAAIQRAAGRVDPVKTSDDITREPGSRYIDFLVPGLIGIGIMSNAVWGLGFSIVDARRRKLTKRLIATPMSRVQFLLSYLIWRKIILFVEVGVPLVFGAIAFGVPIRGHWIDIIILSVLTSFTFAAIGILIACRAKTIEALSGLVNLTIMPMWVCSGVFFSAQRFPDFAQPIIRALPLTAFIDAMRGIQLQGLSLASFGREVATLIVWMVVCFVLALKLFRWR